MLALRKKSSARRLEGVYEPMVRATPWWKRGMDIAGAVAGIALLSPLLITVAALIKVASPGPVLFRQQRVGQGGTPFTMWKFRTMRLDADTATHQDYVTGMVERDAPLEKLSNADQLIPFGLLLRKSGIDELPQLLNVLKGEMSLVGPRPDVVPAEAYHAWHRRRFDVVPGITGLWQVSGKNRTTFREMIQLDIDYIKHQSFWLDLRILCKTLPAIVFQWSDGGSA